MSIIVKIALYLQQYAIFLFILSLAAGYLGRHQFNQGKVRLGYRLILGAAIAASLLAGSYGVIGLLMQEGLTLLLAGLWGFIAYRDWQHVKIIKSQL
jgi:hypothetical protein